MIQYLRIACDAMLGGLARWLRAAGYDACWQSGIDDHDLIRLARDQGRTLLSSDTRIFLFKVGFCKVSLQLKRNSSRTSLFVLLEAKMGEYSVSCPEGVRGTF